MKQDTRKELRIICPVHNEAAWSLRELVREWTPVLDEHLKDWEWVFIDDGSTAPRTLAALEQITLGDPRFQCRRLIVNRGHGQACVYGYREFHNTTRWLLQIDSDGQCRPKDFRTIWGQRVSGLHHFGVRRGRRDGGSRKIISLGVRLYLWLMSGTYHPDPNCPFRLLWCRKLGPHLSGLSHKLANLALALRLKPDSRFSPVGFLLRRCGQSSHNPARTIKALLEFLPILGLGVASASSLSRPKDHRTSLRTRSRAFLARM